MRFKIRQYRRRFGNRFSERSYLFKKKFSTFLDRFAQKGHEKMTVMLIPHNEKKIFNFQISKFTISFFFFLFLLIIATSSYALIKNASVKREEQRLLMTYKDITSQLFRFEKITNNIAGSIDEIKPDIEEIYELAVGTGETENIWALAGLDTGSNDDLKKNRNRLPEEIFTLRKLERDILATTSTIRTVKNFIDVRSKVIKDTPSLVPNHGHITSLFGWRRSPFGHGRDFHRGIDIAAPPGTEIRATAPGVVVSSGWSGGYGNMVHIKHKYGFETIYGHCRAVAATAGQNIGKGQIVGYVGQTGNATGPHCHYEIRLGGVPINPYPYMSRMW